MTSFLRGAGNFWTAFVAGAGALSSVVYVGQAQAVSIMLKNSGASLTVITVQVGGNRVVKPGRNEEPGSGDWYDYSGADAISLAAGASICYDLTPFGPAYVRLKSSVATTLDAFATTNG